MMTMIAFPDIAPEIFTINIGTFSFSLRWYALSYIVGILLGWRLMVHALRQTRLWPDETAPMTSEQADELITWIILGVVLGGRLGYVLFYQPAYYLQNPAEILMVWQGGMAFHGGLLGVILVCLLYWHRHRIPGFSAADVIALGTPIGLCLGRIANFINAELWGRPTSLPWGVAFPGDMAQYCPRVEGVCARHPSQLYEAILEGIILGAVLIFLAYRRGALKYPGLITGVFFLGYGLSRMFVELFRQADAQFISAENPMGYVLHLGGFGLSMGQLLSLPMVLIGLVLIRHARRQVT
ncbi:MAG: prolipoprotein diacylglyceryl transferase [Paracoccus sp. (in: a-proteobacteria)]